ncbi:MAG: phosphate acyltransferase PlsX [Oleibacter sp.]|nr:phosphate acyltransferase PlsX [Thalassolituus sp.]
MLTIAVDAMGGDLGPRVAFKACKRLLKDQSDVQILLPLEPSVQPLAAQILKRYLSRVQFLNCDSHIKMSDHPKHALRNSSGLSMHVALQSVKDGLADGVLSVGNTGALLLLARRILGSLDNLSRPVLATQLPTRGKPILMMDLGANLAMTSEQLQELALLAVAWLKAGGEENPAVGLLNIGSEPSKGPDFIREAGEALTRRTDVNYCGFVEGDRMFDGVLDAVICDGYSGNIALKTTEGLIEWLLDLMTTELGQSKSLGWSLPLWRAALRRVDRKVSPARYGGAILMGINGCVVKTHGKSDERTFRYALEYVSEQIRSGRTKKLNDFYQKTYAVGSLSASINVQLVTNPSQ